MKKQILEIFNKIGIQTESSSHGFVTYFSKDDAASEINIITKEHYMKFIEWLGSIHTANSDGDHWIMRYKNQSDSSNWLTLDELYQYYLDNIKNK